MNGAKIIRAGDVDFKDHRDANNDAAADDDDSLSLSRSLSFSASLPLRVWGPLCLCLSFCFSRSLISGSLEFTNLIYGDVLLPSWISRVLMACAKIQ